MAPTELIIKDAYVYEELLRYLVRHIGNSYQCAHVTVNGLYVDIVVNDAGDWIISANGKQYEYTDGAKAEQGMTHHAPYTWWVYQDYRKGLTIRYTPLVNELSRLGE